MFAFNLRSTLVQETHLRMAKFFNCIAVLGLATSVLGHAVLQTPQPRVVSLSEYSMLKLWY